MPTTRPRRFLILFTTIALAGACGQVAEPPGSDSGIDPSRPDGGGVSPDADPLAPDANGDPLAAHSDPFDGFGIDPAWSQFQPNLIDFEVVFGKLTMAPNGYVQWYNREQGPLLYKEIAGSFRVTSRVRARSTIDPNLPPDEPYDLGGLMARRPGTAEVPSDYVFIVVGRDGNDLSVETKSTVEGMSKYDGPAWGSGDAELRICRIGNLFHMYKRPVDGGAWQLAESFDRPDLPDSVQVGMIAYSPTEQPHLEVSFDELTFATVATQSDCEE